MRYCFSGHESFPCKSMWLKKGYDYLVDRNRFTVSIRPRACFSPSYNKVKSQTKHVWLLTLL